MNIFEGARRISLLVAAITVVASLFFMATFEPYVSVNYSIANPRSKFVKSFDTCPNDSASHYFTTMLSNGESVGINLCLLTENSGNERLIPCDSGSPDFYWLEKPYSDAVSNYKRELEKRFKLSESEEKEIRKKISKEYRANWFTGLGYLVMSLSAFAFAVWAIGWIVRGFCGIPRGMDRHQEEAAQQTQTAEIDKIPPPT